MQNSAEEIARAIEGGDYGTVKALLQEEPELANAVLAEGSTPLHLATLCNHKEIVEILISNGADVNVKDDNGYAPIFGVVFDFEAGDRRGTIKTLIANGADVNTTDTDGMTLLHNAAMNGKREIIELLLANAADPTIKNNAGISAEEFATEAKHPDIAALLAKSAARGDEIHEAIKNDDLDKANMVLKEEPDLANAVDPSGAMPLHNAVMFERKEIVELLISRGADVNGRNRKDQTPLLLAMRLDGKEIAELLISNGADVNSSSSGSPLLHYAVNRNNKAAVELLIAHGADVNARHKEGGTSLHQAAAWSSKEIVELLLASKADPTLKTNSGRTAEEVADEHDHPDIATLLRRAAQDR